MADFNPEYRRTALEPDEVDSSDLIEGLRTTWTVAPPDEDALWARISPLMGEQATSRRSWLFAVLTSGIASTPRVMALGGTAAALAVGMVVASSMLRGSDTASAEVLRAAERLSTTARIALDDSSLTSDEAAAIREQASMLARLLSGDQAALTDLNSSDLDRVATELSNVLVSFDQLGAVDERDVEDARLSVFEAHDAFEDERGRRERESDDGEHEGDRTQTPQASSRGGSDDFEASQAPTAVVAPSAAAATAGTAAPTPSATSKSGGEHDDDEHDEGSSTPTPTVMAGATTVPPTSTSTATATATSTPSSTASATATSTPSATPTSSATAQAGGSGSATIPGNAGAFTWSVGSAGTVAFTFDGHEDFEVTGVNAATGWTASVQEADGSEIRVRFTKSGLTTTFTASREDHSIEVTVSGGGGG